MSNPVKITPFLPGHFEVFDLKLNGKVESVQLERFHCCTEEPKHAAYDNVENLGTGKDERERSGITGHLIIHPLSILLGTPIRSCLFPIDQSRGSRATHKIMVTMFTSNIRMGGGVGIGKG